jgi:hypothetical protein
MAVSVDITGMLSGAYTNSITISAPGATNTPQTIPVSLTIAPPPAIAPAMSERIRRELESR